ncbi:glycine cleavage system H-protein subunit [Arachnomyces sp. PD_36]|nr:glycine cleavage system H-protein subunit [Arachnomyces sp. PD_36]
MSAATVASRALRPMRTGLLSQKLSSCPRRVTASYFPRETIRSFSRSSVFQVKRYTEQHEWIELSEDKTTAKIGITTHAATSLGDVVYVELPTPDTEVSAGETIGAVESVKSASDIMSPVTGTVLEANTILEEKPGVLNKSPEEDGWIAKMEVKDASEVEGLMDGEAYKSSLDTE